MVSSFKGVAPPRSTRPTRPWACGPVPPELRAGSVSSSLVARGRGGAQQKIRETHPPSKETRSWLKPALEHRNATFVMGNLEVVVYPPA